MILFKESYMFQFVCEVFRVKFVMESDALVVLGQRSQVESEDLGVLVRRLFEAAEPLSGQVNLVSSGGSNE